MPLSDVKRAIYQCIVEVYGRHFNKTLQAAPEQIWRKEAPLHGRPYVDDLAALDIALALHELSYRVPEPLAELLADLLPRQAPRSGRPGTAKVKLKYHPEDLSRVYIWNEVRRRYVTLPCTQIRYAQGLSEHHHQLIRDFALAEHLAFQSEDERCLARVRLQELILPSLPLAKVRDRQNIQRLKGELPLAPLEATPGPPEFGIPIGTLVGRADGGRPHRAPVRVSKRKVREIEPPPIKTAPAKEVVSPFRSQFEPTMTVALFEEFFAGAAGEGA